MSHKGSGYRRKHFIEKIDRRAQEELEIAENPCKAVLYHDEGYIEDFYNLSVEEAGHAYELLSKSAQDYSDIAQKLDEVLAAAGFKISQHSGRFLHKQELLTIRMDFHGTIDRIKDGLRQRELSPYYRYLISHPLDKSSKANDYDFKTSPSWKLFSRFESFRQIEGNLKVYLLKHKIDPIILKLMTPRDFSDLVVQCFQKSKEEQKITFQKDITVRNEFVRDLAKHNGKKMIDMLLKQGWDERYVRSMVNMMKKHGKSNSSKLIITEIRFTPRVLIDLKKAEKACLKDIQSKEFFDLESTKQNELKNLYLQLRQVNVQKFRPGDVIPQVLIDTAIDADKGYIFVARDKNGQILRGEDFPSFTVHHKHAASDAGVLKSVAYANYKNNLCLVREDIHSSFIHRRDKIVRREEMTSYAKRLEFIEPHIAFMIGFHPYERMAYDFYRGKRLKRQIMDNKYNVSYDECMKELALNHTTYDRMHNKKVFNADEIIQCYKSYRKTNKKRKMSLKRDITR